MKKTSLTVPPFLIIEIKAWHSLSQTLPRHLDSQMVPKRLHTKLFFQVLEEQHAHFLQCEILVKKVNRGRRKRGANIGESRAKGWDNKAERTEEWESKGIHLKCSWETKVLHFCRKMWVWDLKPHSHHYFQKLFCCFCCIKNCLAHQLVLVWCNGGFDDVGYSKCAYSISLFL